MSSPASPLSASSALAPIFCWASWGGSFSPGTVRPRRAEPVLIGGTEMQPEPDLSYQQQSPEVSARLARLKAREVILRVENLDKRFGARSHVVTALKGISFKTHRREFLCIVGPSGCGKSTLIRILAGLDDASSGIALLDETPITGPGRERGMVFQGYTLFPWLTVKRNVMFGLEVNGRGKDESEQQALQWLALIGLERFAEAYPHQL